MTIWFHEGLPRSGKSYESMVKHCLPAIQKGRLVVSNIKGINPEKIAEVLEMPLETVQALIVQIPWDETKNCLNYVQNDCLLMIDEVQDFWPSDKSKLPPDVTELVTQHGQRGMDIILMGQSLKDCHNLWRRRVDKLIYFVKKDAVGKPDSYSWRLSKQVGDGKFSQIATGSSAYDKKYFGIYKSHVDDVDNTAAYEDKRANVWNTPALKYGVPAAVVALVVAVGFLWHFFTAPTAILGSENSAKLGSEVPPVFRLPRDSVHATSFSFC